MASKNQSTGATGVDVGLGRLPSTVVVMGLRCTEVVGLLPARTMPCISVVEHGCDGGRRRVFASFGRLGGGVGIDGVWVMGRLGRLERLRLRGVDLRMPLWGSVSRVMVAIRMGRRHKGWAIAWGRG